MQITDLGEFGLIERIKAIVAASPGTIGIGDDCAVIPLDPDNVQLFTTDLLIENTHFLLDHIPPAALGHKALAVNLSDIAAMGGIPNSVLLSLALRPDISIEWLDEWMCGFQNLAQKSGVTLIGGDTTHTQNTIAISVTAIGAAKKSSVKLRSAAKAGDILCVTGNLGDSKAGLDCILQKRPPSDLHDRLIARHYNPQPHLAEGQFLASYETVHAMMDISDGLVGDIQHIMKQSNCGATIALDRLPKSAELIYYTTIQNQNTDEFAFAGGEDYCLLVTIAADTFAAIADDFLKCFGRPLYNIGTITERGLRLTCHGKPTNVNPKGYDHFS